MLSQLPRALKKLPGDLERGLTRAFNATSRPAEFAKLLQQFAQLPEHLGVGDAPAAAPAAVAAGGSSEAEGAEGSSPAVPLPASLQGVQSELLRQLLQAAASPAVAAAATEMLAALDLAAAAANDKINVLK